MQTEIRYETYVDGQEYESVHEAAAAILQAAANPFESTDNPDTTSQLFPGYLDRGTPLIIQEGGRSTVVGLFHEQDNPSNKPTLFSKIHPDVFNWIVKYSDGTHDSRCESFISCSCKYQHDGGATRKFSASVTRWSHVDVDNRY